MTLMKPIKEFTITMRAIEPLNNVKYEMERGRVNLCNCMGYPKCTETCEFSCECREVEVTVKEKNQ